MCTLLSTKEVIDTALCGFGIATYQFEIVDLDAIIYCISSYKNQISKSYGNATSFAVIELLIDKLTNNRVLVESAASPSGAVLVDDITINLIKSVLATIVDEFEDSIFKALADVIFDGLDNLQHRA